MAIICIVKFCRRIQGFVRGENIFSEIGFFLSIFGSHEQDFQESRFLNPNFIRPCGFCGPCLSQLGRLDISVNEIFAMDKLNSRNQLDSKKFSPWTAMWNSPGSLLSRWMKFLQFRPGSSRNLASLSIACGIIGTIAQTIVSDLSVGQLGLGQMEQFFFIQRSNNFLLNRLNIPYWILNSCSWKVWKSENLFSHPSASQPRAEEAAY